MIAYRLKTWVHTYDTWFLWEGYGIIHMLLINWTYGTYGHVKR
jgi:hypothetical protein